MADINPNIVERVEWEPENDEPRKMRAFDEIVTGPVDSIHIERMDDGLYWMGIYKGDERQVVVIGAKNLRAKVIARTEEQ